MIWALLFLAAAEPVDPLDVAGVWYPGSATSQVEITAEGDSVAGRIIWYDGIQYGPNYDTENPDEELRGRTILGLPLIADFKKGRDKWRRGTIYDPNEGKTYRSAIALKNENTLIVQGCIALFCQTQEWPRVPEDKIIRGEYPKAPEAE